MYSDNNVSVNMERTISKLNRQINHKLTGIHDYEAININSRLGGLLDCYDIPENAKLACSLSILQ